MMKTQITKICLILSLRRANLKRKKYMYDIGKAF